MTLAIARLAPVPILVAVGLLAASSTQAALLALALSVLFVAAVLRGENLWWDLLFLGLAGSLLLDYGFANAGVQAPVPIPLSAILLAAALAGAALLSRPGIPRAAPLIFAFGFFCLATIRIVTDYPVWGTGALRDYSIAYELGYLLAGYWAMSVFGLERWLVWLRWIFLVCLAYFLLYPWRDTLVSLSPQVGLQRSVPLVGNYVASGAGAAAGLFYFIVVRPFGRRSYVLAALFVPAMLLFQSRGLYVAVPAAALALVALSLGANSSRIVRSLGITVGIGLAVATAFLAFAPEGRLGRASPDFVRAQLATLTGAEGPGAGSFRDRVTWFNDVIAKVEATDYGWARGVGLGPDLAAGFRPQAVPGAEGDTQILARKPHNDYLEVYARFGLLGLVLFGGMLASAIAITVRGARRARGLEGRFLWWAVAVSVVYGVIAAVQPLLAYSYGTAPLFCTLGASLALVRAQQGRS
jgi:O-antigen ligase